MILPAQKQHRLFFQFVLPALILLEDRFGTGTEGSVVKKDDVWVEKEVGR
jgi:hypothetical protein